MAETSPHGRSLLRFWWVVALGVVAAVGVAYVVKTKTSSESYTTAAELLVTSPQAPYFRTEITNVTSSARSASGAGNRTPVPANLPLTVSTSPPDVNTLVRAANLYPFFIESDLVAAEREKRFGPLPGTVSARAIFAVASAARFEASDIPIIQVIGQGSTPKQAITITQRTAEAFISWIRATQSKAALKPKERILIEEIKRPSEVFATGGTSTSLILLVGAAVILAFGVLAVVLDRTFARRVKAVPDEKVDRTRAPQSSV
jgi:hypothetical protein